MNPSSRVCLWLLSLAVVFAGACSKDPEVAKREFLASGDRFAAEQKYPEALIQYRNAVQQDPKFGIARRKLSEMHLRTRDLQAALGEGVRAADLLPSDLDAQMWAGQMLLGLGQFADAQARADRALALDPKNVEAQILRANALAGLRKLDDAVSAIESALREHPDRTEGYGNLATIEVMRGKTLAAEAAFRRAVEMAPQAVQPKLALANFLWATKRVDEAERMFKATLEIDPKNILANRALAAHQINVGRPAQAEPYFKTVAGLLPVEGPLLLADYYIAMHRLDDARAVLIALSQPTTAARLRLVVLEAARGNEAGARSILEEVLKAEPANVTALLAKANMVRSEGKTAEALTLVSAAAKNDPRSAQAQLQLGILRTDMREEQAALAAFKRALELNPRMAQAALGTATVHLQAGREDVAAKFAQDAIAIVPGYFEAGRLLSQIQLSRGDVAAAERFVRGAMKTFPNDTELLLQLGEIESRKGNLAAARRAFDKVTAQDPGNAKAVAGAVFLDLAARRPDAAKARVDTALKAAPANSQLLLVSAQAYARLGDLGATERLTRQAIEADALNFDAYTYLGALYMAQKRVTEGIALYTAAAAKQPNAVGPPTMLGILNELQQKPAEAAQFYQRALAIDSTTPVAANNLAWMYAENGTHLDEALQLAQTAKARRPDLHQVNDTLGWAYLKKKLPDQAIAPLEQAVRAAPTVPSYRYHLGLAYMGSNRKSDARRELLKTLELNPAFANAAAVRQALTSLGGA